MLTIRIENTRTIGFLKRDYGLNKQELSETSERTGKTTSAKQVQFQAYRFVKKRLKLLKSRKILNFKFTVRSLEWHLIREEG